jgi:hypothetical protein
VEWPRFIYVFWRRARTRRRVARQCDMYARARETTRPSRRARTSRVPGRRRRDACHRGDVARRDRMDADPRRAPTPSTTSPHAIPTSHGTGHLGSPRAACPCPQATLMRPTSSVQHGPTRPHAWTAPTACPSSLVFARPRGIPRSGETPSSVTES